MIVRWKPNCLTPNSPERRATLGATLAIVDYQPPAIEHRERIDEPLVVGSSNTFNISPTWRDAKLRKIPLDDIGPELDDDLNGDD